MVPRMSDLPSLQGGSETARKLGSASFRVLRLLNAFAMILPSHSYKLVPLSTIVSTSLTFRGLPTACPVADMDAVSRVAYYFPTCSLTSFWILANLIINNSSSCNHQTR